LVFSSFNPREGGGKVGNLLLVFHFSTVSSSELWECGNLAGFARFPRSGGKRGNPAFEVNPKSEKESCGNDGVVESVEIQKQDSPSSHHSLEISQNQRDSHIPTAPTTRRWKSGKPKWSEPQK
jgi:hypothetical protein